MNRAIALVLVMTTLGCARFEPLAERGPSAHDDAQRPAAFAAAAPSAEPGTQVEASQRVEADAIEDPVVVALGRARITSLVPIGRVGVFTAVLEGKPGSQAQAELTLDLVTAPLSQRRPFALYKLSHALGMHVVPAAAFRRMGAGELTRLLEADPQLFAFMRAVVVIQNDGTVDSLLSARSPGGLDTAWQRPPTREVAVHSSYELDIWTRWAASPEPFIGESPLLLRDFVELLVLDYLSGNVLRRTVLVDAAGQRLILADNGTAFPPRVDAEALDRVLVRLKQVTRFPKTLRERLERLDRDQMEALFLPGGFDTWILSPRNVMELEERRTTLLTLLDARIRERGADAVLRL
jgi:hypothetical protein